MTISHSGLLFLGHPVESWGIREFFQMRPNEEELWAKFLEWGPRAKPRWGF